MGPGTPRGAQGAKGGAAQRGARTGAEEGARRGSPEGEPGGGPDGFRWTLQIAMLDTLPESKGKPIDLESKPMHLEQIVPGGEKGQEGQALSTFDLGGGLRPGDDFGLGARGAGFGLGDGAQPGHGRGRARTEDARTAGENSHWRAFDPDVIAYTWPVERAVVPPIVVSP